MEEVKPGWQDNPCRRAVAERGLNAHPPQIPTAGPCIPLLKQYAQLKVFLLALSMPGHVLHPGFGEHFNSFY